MVEGAAAMPAGWGRRPGGVAGRVGSPAGWGRRPGGVAGRVADADAPAFAA
jgi:hypothetical protein